MNNDGKVDGYDLLVLKKAIEKNTQLSSLSGGVPYYDVNGDCKLNNSDYGALVNALESNLTSSLSSNYTDYFEGP